MPAMESKERLVSIHDEHWMIYVVPVLICVLLFLSSLFFFYMAGITIEHSVWLWQPLFTAASVFLLFSIHGFFLVILGESVSSIIVTSKRVIRFHEVIMFKQEMLEVSFEKMKTVEARKSGLLQTLLNYGSLRFEKDASMNFVPYPSRVARDIEQLMGNR